PRPFYTPDFFRALGTSVLLVALTLIVWRFNGSESLRKAVFGAESTPVYEIDSLRNFFFVKEDYLPDSAILANNFAVNVWDNWSSGRASVFNPNRPRVLRVMESVTDYEVWDIAFDRALANLRRAIDYRKGDYPLAKDNLARLRYNLGNLHYRFVLADSAQMTRLDTARSFLRQVVANDSLRSQAWHVIGLSFYYENKADSAFYYYEQIRRTDSLFFRVAEVPNLETLLAPAFLKDLVAQKEAGQTPSQKPESQKDQPSKVPTQNEYKKEPIPKKIPEPELYGFWEAVENRPRKTTRFYFRKDGRAHVLVYEENTLALALSGNWKAGGGRLYLGLPGLNLEPEIQWLNDHSFKLSPQRLQSDVQPFSGSPLTFRRLDNMPNADFDGDRVPDFEDECPFLNGQNGQNGCPAPLHISALNLAAFEGEWAGTGTRTDKRQKWSLRLTISSTGTPLTVEYPDMNCAGTWIPIAAQTGKDGYFTLRVRENITQNNQNQCASGSLLILRQTGPETIEVTLRHAFRPKIIATAILTKKAGQKTVDIPVPKMVLVKGGTFQMGCLEGRDDLNEPCNDDEKPAHTVTLSDFQIGKYEISNREFVAFLENYGDIKIKDGPNQGQLMIGSDKAGIEIREFKGDRVFRIQKGWEDAPVAQVTWFGAAEYCRWLSAQTGKNYRLPTEAEWEFAARGGRQSRGFVYAGNNDLREVGWYIENAKSQKQPRGQKQPNELGLYDMSGNVEEWCQDWYDGGYYQKGPENNPQGPYSGSSRVVRGGSSNDPPANCRAANRAHKTPNDRTGYLGFRVVLAR
ncbi:MAG: formylglycine-generating enzyme family protein, partial [Bacteroidetes bacterium]